MEERQKVGPFGISILLLIGAALAWLVAHPHALRAETTLKRAQRRGLLRIGYANEAPYGYLDTATGRVTGEAPEIAAVLLARLGIDEIEGVVTEFGALIPGLKARRFDMIAAGMYVTPERCREIRFTNPTYAIGEAFIVLRGNPLDLHGFEDVASHPRARLGVVGGAVEHRYARSVGVPDERTILLPDNASGLAAVLAGRIDAFAATSLTVNDLMRKADDVRLERAAPFEDPIIDGKKARGYGAFGCRKEDIDLVRELNAQLESFIGTAAHLALVRPFGFTESELPGDVSADELCRKP